MADVIFNGSGTPQAAGHRPRSTLTFDNADRRLADRHRPRSTSPAALYRSGESEYLINSKPVPARATSASCSWTPAWAPRPTAIIEQGKVDVLLQAIAQRPAARSSRRPPASAGTRPARSEALRKLERVEQNLLRLDDIVDEVEKRLRSVKYQAGKARNYQEYDRQLREKRATFSLAEYHRLTRATAASWTRRDRAPERRGHRACGRRSAAAEARSSTLDGDLLMLGRRGARRSSSRS